MPFFPLVIFIHVTMGNLHILAFAGDVLVVSSQRGDKHDYISSLFKPPVTLPPSHLIFSLSVTLSLLLPAHPLPSNSLGGSQDSNWQASRETEKKKWKEREWGRERQWYKGGKVPGTIVHIFPLCHVSYFCFHYPPHTSLLLLHYPSCFLVCSAPGRSKFNPLMCD